MERKQKRISTIILMVVGVLFVVVAGGVFVSSTWKLLSETAKQILLFCLSAGLLGGGIVLGKKSNLKITSLALFYLGTVGAGLFTYSVLGFLGDSQFALAPTIQRQEWNTNSIRFAFADLVIMGILAYHFTASRKVYVAVLEYVAANAFIIGLSRGFQLPIVILYVGLALILALLIGLNRRLHIWDSIRGMVLATSIMYYCQAGNGAIMVLGKSLRLGANQFYGYATVLSAILLVSLVIWWNRTKVGGILVSAALFLLAHSFACDLIVEFEELLTDSIVNVFYYEFYCAIIGLALLVLGWIWREDQKAQLPVSIIRFIGTTVLYYTLLAHCFWAGKLANVISLGVVCLIAFILSAIRSNRKYQIASGSVMVILALYMTRSFWLALGWWVYLLAAGVVCMAIAIIWERKYSKERSKKETE